LHRTQDEDRKKHSPIKKQPKTHTHNTTKKMNNLAPTIKLEETQVYTGKIQTFLYLLYCIILILKEQKCSIVRHMMMISKQIKYRDIHANKSEIK
jgi:hypothetical protein